MEQKRLLFFAKCPMNHVLFEPVYDRLVGTPGVEFYFTGKLGGRKDPALVYEDFDLRGGQLVRNSVARMRSYDLYLTPDFRVASKRSRIKVHMFHGFSIRNFAIQERVLDFDRLFLIGPYMKRRFLESGILDQDDRRIVEVGMPKLDPLVNGLYRREDVLAELGLDPDRKTVLFAPTWIEGGCLDVQGEEIIQNLARLPVNTIIKLHDNSFDVRKQRRDWGRDLPGLLGERQVLASGPNSNPYLAASDLLVSDASSIANEYLLLNRPLIFFRLDELEEKWPATDRQGWGTSTGFVVDRAAELLDTVPAALDDPSRHEEKRLKAARDFFYHPGESAPRAAKHLLEYMGLEAGDDS